MRRLVAAVVALSAGCAPAPSDDPGLILTGGVIHTFVGPAGPVEAIAIRGDTIVALGDDVAILALAGRYTQQMDLEGAAVLPGTYDAWIDLEAVGRWSEAALDLRRASSVDEVQAMVRNASGIDAEDAIVGWGWDENNWPSPVLPGRLELDGIVADRPVVLVHRNGRAAWINSAAFGTIGAAAGMAGDGIITGAAFDALAATIAGDEATRRDWLAAGARFAAGRGITRAATPPVDIAAVEALLELDDQGLLPLRVDVRLDAAGTTYLGDGDLEQRLATSALVRIAAVGLRLDGPIASRLAALSRPYEDGTDAAFLAGGELRRAAIEASRTTGLPLHVQASGDAAVAQASIAIAETGVDGGMIVGLDLRPEDPVGMPIDVAIAPSRFSIDIYQLDALLGPERAARAHAWRDLAGDALSVSFASDAPASDVRPLAAVAAVLTRQDASGYPAGGWHPEQTLPQERLARALAGPPGVPGSGLVDGGPADLVVWSEDPLTAGPVALRRAEAMVTIVNGRVAFSRPLVDPNAR